MKTVLLSLSTLAFLVGAQPAHALSNCFYQHLGVPDGYAFTTASQNGDYLGDTTTVEAQAGTVRVSWADQATGFSYTLNALDSGPHCSIEADANDPANGKILLSTKLDVGASCGVGAQFETIVEYPTEFVQQQLQKRVANKGTIYTGVEIACFGN